MSSIDRAFKQIHRGDFIPEDQKNLAGRDAPLPIGFGQTISQPSTVHLMMEWLDTHAGDKVLDVGSGSGWTSALLSEITGPKGTVFAVERIPELVLLGRSNCSKANLKNVKFFQAGREYGLPRHSPYDRILVSASARSLPHELLDQLKIGGKLVIPIRNDILEISKISNKKFETVTHPGFVFVPLLQVS